MSPRPIDSDGPLMLRLSGDDGVEWFYVRITHASVAPSIPLRDALHVAPAGPTNKENHA